MSQIRATCGAAVVRRRTSSSRGIRRPCRLEETALPQVSGEIPHRSRPLTNDSALPHTTPLARATRGNKDSLDVPHPQTAPIQPPHPQMPTTPPARCLAPTETIEVDAPRSTSHHWRGRRRPTVPSLRNRVLDAPRLPDPHGSPLRAAQITPDPRTPSPRTPRSAQRRAPGPHARTRRRKSPSRCRPTTAGRVADRLLPLDVRIGVRPLPPRRHLDAACRSFVDRSSADPDASAGSSSSSCS